MASSIIPRTSGIYIIVHIKSGKVYIGQARNIRSRWDNHHANLNRGTHGNRHLQSAWNKYGEKAFRFQVLEHCSVEQLNEREQHYLDIYMPKGICYNIAIDARYTQRGIVRSPEIREKIANTLRGRKSSPETKEKIATSQKGRRHTEETKNKLSAMKKGVAPSLNTRIAQLIAMEKTWVVTSPNGEEMTIKNLRKFCDENGLNCSCMSEVAQGKHAHHKGWKCSKKVIPL